MFNRTFRWWIVGLILLATTINYIDRQAISVAAPLIKQEFGMTNEDYSWVVTAFLLAYALMQVGAGSIIDRIGVKRGFSVAIIWWSVANMLHVLGRGMGSFAGMRFLLGLGEAGNFPAAMKAIAEWFPTTERSKAVGILNMGPGLGAVIAPPLIAWLILGIGWRGAFVVTGLFGLVWLVLWHFFYESPERNRWLSDAERSHILSHLAAQGLSQPPLLWKQYFGYSQMWGVALCRFCSDGVFYFFTFWLPSYLAQEKGFNLVQIGAFAWIPFLANDLGSIAGGWLGSTLMHRGWSLNGSRKAVMWLGAVLVVPVMACQYAEAAWVAIALIALAMFGTQIKAASVFALPVDLFAAKDAATAWGISGSAGSFGAMLFTPLIGWLADHAGYSPIFWIVAFLHVISALFVMWLVPKVEMVEVSTH